MQLDDTILSIHFAINGVPFTVKIGHLFLAAFGELNWGSLSDVSFIEPLYINDASYDEKSSTERQASEVTPLSEPSLLSRVKEGLELYSAELCEEGVNGTYFMKDKDGEIIAVFKPQDEEGQGSPKPQDKDAEVINRGIVDGEGALREVAAYMLDRDHFSGVPETLLVEIPHFKIAGKDVGTKTGSLQEFVQNEGASWDMGPGRFPVHEVHKIGVLDLRIFNNDRHGGNILLKEGSEGNYELIPIDHGLSLSPTLQYGNFEWMMWPQAKKPFEENTKEYIKNIDVEADAQLLSSLGVRPECVTTMKITTTLLKKAAAAGLSLYDIGNLASRTILEEPSEIEKMVESARKQVQEQDESAFLEALWGIMDDKIASKKCN